MGASFDTKKQVKKKNASPRKLIRRPHFQHHSVPRPVMRPRPPFHPGRIPPPGMRPLPPPVMRGHMMRGRMPLPNRMGGPRGHPPGMRPAIPPNMRPPPGMRPLPPHMIRPMPPMLRPPNGPMFRPLVPPPLLPHNRMHRPILSKGKIMKKKRPIMKAPDLAKPWVTEQLKAEFSKKDDMLRNAKNTQNSADWSSFRDQREKCYTLYNSSKAEYLETNPEDDRIPQLMPSNQPTPIVTAPIDYTADVIL